MESYSRRTATQTKTSEVIRETSGVGGPCHRASFAHSLNAQDTTGRLIGVVRDASRAALPGASDTLPLATVAETITVMSPVRADMTTIDDSKRGGR